MPILDHVDCIFSSFREARRMAELSALSDRELARRGHSRATLNAQFIAGRRAR